MSKTTVRSPKMEPVLSSHRHLLCWKSAFAGLLISIMSYVILTALGAGIGGLTAENMIHHERGTMALATGAGLWLGLSAVVSLFLGSYFSLRISKFVTYKVGAAHGFVIASLFFILMLMGTSSVVGSLSMGFGRIAEGVGQSTATMATDPMVQDTFNRALGTASLKSPAPEVARGLMIRLLQGDMDSVKNYYAYQTGLTPADVDAKVNQLKMDFDASVQAAAERTARGVADTGWALFVLFMVGLLAAVMGGRVGAHANVERPFAASASSELDPYTTELIPAR